MQYEGNSSVQKPDCCRCAEGAQVPKALIMCSVTNSHRGGGFDIWAQFCLNILPVVLSCLENHKRRNLIIIGERDCTNAPNIWQRCKEWPTASELMFTKSRKSEEQVWVVNDACKNALYWFSFQRSQSSDFDKWSVGLGEIGPEDPNFKIKTCTLGFWCEIEF